MKAHNLFIQKNESPDGDCPYVLIGSHDPSDGMDGEVAHVFGDDEAAAENLAREILDQMSVAGGGESGVLEVNEYQLMGGGPGDLVDLRIVRRRQRDGCSKWAVVERGFVLNRQGEWEIEPTIRDPFFLARCRFSSVEDALKCWETAVVRSMYQPPVEEVEERPSPEIVRDLLLLVHEQEVDLEFLDSLAADDLQQIQQWAALEHLGGNDNDVEVPPMPHCLVTYFRLASGGQ
jgi:hypothetical protein